MVHDRIGDEDGVEDVVAVDVAFRADLADQVVDRLAHGTCHGLAAVRVHHHVGDAAHQILAEADLRVRRAGGGDDAARQQRHQMHGDGGRADVAGDAVGLVLEAGPQRDDERAATMSLSRWMAAVTPQLPLRKMPCTCGIRWEAISEVLPAPVLFQRELQPVEVAERLVHVGLFDLDIAELDGRVALDMAVVGGLAHDLRVDDRVLRHVDDEVALDLSPSRTGGAARAGRARARSALPSGPWARCGRWRRRSCAWRNCLPAPRSGSGRRWRGRRTRSRHRRRAGARHRAPACRRESARACPTA